MSQYVLMCNKSDNLIPGHGMCEFSSLSISCLSGQVVSALVSHGRRSVVRIRPEGLSHLVVEMGTWLFLEGNSVTRDADHIIF